MQPPKKKYRALSLLHWWMKFFGLNPISLTKSGKFEFSFFGFVYGYILCGACVFIIYRTMLLRLSLAFPGETPISLIIDILGFSWQGCEICSLLLVFATFQNSEFLVIKSFIRVEKNATELELAEVDSDKFFREVAKSAGLLNVLYFLSWMFSNVLWAHFSIMENVTMLLFQLPSLLSTNMVIIYIWSLIYAKRKFCSLNVKMSTVIEKIARKKSLKLLKRSSYDYAVFMKQIDSITQLHRDLREFVRLVTKHFSLPLLFCIIRYFTYMTLNAYGIYRFLKVWSMQSGSLSSYFVYIGAMCHWLLRPIISLVYLSELSTATINEANSTGSVLHIILNKFCHFDDEEQFFDILSLEFLKNPLDISLYGLVKINEFLFYSILSASLTYLVTMFQFYT